MKSTVWFSYSKGSFIFHSFLINALFIENKDSIRIRLRSKGPRIDLLANKYNGGGHMLASGATLPSWDMLDKFISEIDEINKEYMNN